jgi:mRNA interferase RelE/StbE
LSVWQVETTPEFDKAFAKLDRAIQSRVLRLLDELGSSQDPRTKGRRLSGELAGYWRYRVGDYRVLAEIFNDRLVIVAVTVGHRGAIYT